MESITISDMSNIVVDLLRSASNAGPESQRIISNMFEGGAGIGKTDIILDTAREYGAEFAKVDSMNFNTPGDFAGALDIVDGKSVNAPREEFERLSNTPIGTPGILLLDDVKRLHNQLLQEVMDLELYGQIGPGKFLPPNIVVVSTANPGTGIYYGNKFDPAQVTRKIKFIVEPNVVEWLKWAINNDVHKKIIDFISEYPGELYDSQTSMKNPRMWTLLSKSIKMHESRKGLVGKIISNNLPAKHMFLEYYKSSASSNGITLENLSLLLKDEKVDEVIAVIDKARRGSGGIAEQHHAMRLITIIASHKRVDSSVLSRVFSSDSISPDIAVVYLKHFRSIRGFSDMIHNKELANRIKRDNIMLTEDA